MNERFEYFDRRLEEQRKWHARRADWNKKSYYGAEIITLVAGALIPVVNIGDWHAARLLSALLASLVLLASGVSKLYKFQENWLNYRGLAEALKLEEEMYLNAVGEYRLPDVQQRNGILVERVEGILASTTSQFLLSHKAERERPSTPSLPGSEKPSPSGQ